MTATDSAEPWLVTDQGTYDFETELLTWDAMMCLAVVRERGARRAALLELTDEDATGMDYVLARIADADAARLTPGVALVPAELRALILSSSRISRVRLEWDEHGKPHASEVQVAAADLGEGELPQGGLGSGASDLPTRE